MCIYWKFSNLLKVKDKWVVKSGTDFKDFSLIEIAYNNSNKLDVKSIERYIVDSRVKEDEELKYIVEEFLSI